MSLINEMLKDLETKPKAEKDALSILNGLRAETLKKLSNNKFSYLVICLLAALLLLMVGFGILHKHRHAHFIFANKTIAKPTIADNAPALMTGIALQLQDNISSLRLMLNKKIDYKTQEDKQAHQLTIIFSHTQLNAALPQIDYQGSGIEKLEAFADENKNLKLVIQLNNTSEVKTLKLNETGKAPELQLDILNQGNELVASVENSATLPAKIKKPTLENVAEQDYEYANMLLSNNKPLDAIQVLKTTLLHYPDQVKARELLASLYMQTKNFDEADKILSEGLLLKPNQDSFIELKAKLLSEQGKIKDAIALLIVNSPTLSEDPDYHSFIAALYQQNGQSNLAANLYRQLITMQPNNSKWWLGLGIALESEGNGNQAAEAYTNAENLGGLNPELQAYIDTRLHNA